MSKYNDLEQRTTKFAIAVAITCTGIQTTLVTKEILKQLIRSSGSIGANYREANHCITKKDRIHKINLSRKEANETEHWLQILRGITENHEIESLLIELDRTTKNIHSY